MTKILLDTDPGVDDALTILMALSADNIEISRVTTVFGNVDIDKTTSNAEQVLTLGGRGDIPISRGAAKPLMGDVVFAEHIHGADGLGGQSIASDRSRPTDAAATLVREIQASETPVTLVGLGPLTNFAQALMIEPGIVSNIEKIVVQGGAVLTWGNTTAAASFNHFSDPEAAHIVYTSGAPVVQVGLDVCRPGAMPGAALLPFRDSTTEAGRFIWSLLENHWTVQETGGVRTDSVMDINDALCVAYLVDPSLFETEFLPVSIELTGKHTRGATVADFERLTGQEPNVTVCLGLDVPRYRELVVELLGGHAW